MEVPFISVGLSNRYRKVPLALGKIPGEEDRDFQAWSPSTGWGTGTIPGLQSVLIKVFPVVWKIKKWCSNHFTKPNNPIEEQRPRSMGIAQICFANDTTGKYKFSTS